MPMTRLDSRLKKTKSIDLVCDPPGNPTFRPSTFDNKDQAAPDGLDSSSASGLGTPSLERAVGEKSSTISAVTAPSPMFADNARKELSNILPPPTST